MVTEAAKGSGSREERRFTAGAEAILAVVRLGGGDLVIDGFHGLEP